MGEIGADLPRTVTGQLPLRQGLHPPQKVVPEEGVEPTLPYGNQILSLARLPIPPLRPGSGHDRQRAFQVNKFVSWHATAFHLFCARAEPCVPT